MVIMHGGILLKNQGTQDLRFNRAKADAGIAMAFIARQLHWTSCQQAFRPGHAQA
jgi:hypothetical protein